MIEILWQILVFLILWIPVFFLHEVCHKIEAWRQGGRTSIKIWWHKGFPSIRCMLIDTIPDLRAFYWAGGLYAGVILMGIGIPLHTLNVHIIGLPIITYACMNIFYSVYEGSLLDRIPLNVYMRYHWWVYLAGGICGFIFYWLVLI